MSLFHGLARKLSCTVACPWMAVWDKQTVWIVRCHTFYNFCAIIHIQFKLKVLFKTWYFRYLCHYTTLLEFGNVCEFKYKVSTSVTVWKILKHSIVIMMICNSCVNTQLHFESMLLFKPQNLNVWSDFHGFEVPSLMRENGKQVLTVTKAKNWYQISI